MNEDERRAIIRDFGRQNAAKRRVVQATCAVCGTSIAGIAKRRYCSDACRVRAYYRRKHRLPIADADQLHAAQHADVPRP